MTEFYQVNYRTRGAIYNLVVTDPNYEVQGVYVPSIIYSCDLQEDSIDCADDGKSKHVISPFWRDKLPWIRRVGLWKAFETVCYKIHCETLLWRSCFPSHSSNTLEQATHPHSSSSFIGHFWISTSNPSVLSIRAQFHRAASSIKTGLLAKFPFVA